MGKNESKVALTEDEIQFLKSNSKFSEEEIIEWYEEFKTENPDLKVTKSKFGEFYKDVIQGNPEKYSDRIFDVFDADKSGFLDFPEFLQCINFVVTDNFDAKLDWTFKLYDVDGNGSIDFEEMEKILSYLCEIVHPNVQPARVKKRAVLMFHHMDLNADGRITKDEFVKAIKDDNEMSKIITQPVEQIAGNIVQHYNTKVKRTLFNDVLFCD